jgi:hypothetical protein
VNEYVPTPGPDLYRPRLIRVVTGAQPCPKCEKVLHRSYSQSGWGFHTCEHRKCDQEFWSLALPPDAFAGYLAAVVGEHGARALLVKAFPKSAHLEPPELWGFQLNPTDDTAWIQVAVRPRERHLHRRSRIAPLINALLL